ncbi:MAG TPA: hypothetical protein VM165_10135 [Planctomycetaceae bacterium]|nr:hypothetical protein [Planctomycetaceae bacterium]
MTTARIDFEFVDDQMADILRQKTEVERLRIAGRMWRSARVILRGAIKTDHPDWSDEQVNREIARRISHGVVTS